MNLTDFTIVNLVSIYLTLPIVNLSEGGVDESDLF